MYDYNKGLIKTALFNANQAQANNANLSISLELADETAIQLYEQAMEQEQINNAQDEALIELYELVAQ